MALLVGLYIGMVQGCLCHLIAINVKDFGDFDVQKWNSNNWKVEWKCGESGTAVNAKSRRGYS